MAAAGDAHRITVGELGRRLERIETEFAHGLAGLHRRLDELNYVHPETLDTKLLLEQAHRLELERRLAGLEAENSERKRETAANRRMVWTALVFPIVTAIAAALIVGAMR